MLDHPQELEPYILDDAEGALMKMRVVVLSCCVAMAAVLACAQGMDEGFQPARVVGIEKLAENAQHMSDETHYKISMRLNGALYVCQVSAPVATFIDWSPGKEFPAKVDGKILLVKNLNGQIVQMNIKKISH
jgi:hypothetical protein